MARGFAVEPKLSTVGTRPGAEEVVPDPVDEHPGGQRVVRVRSASGPAPAGRSDRRAACAGSARSRRPPGSRGDRLAGPADLAALQQGGVGDLLAVEHAHRQREGAALVVDLLQLPLDAPRVCQKMRRASRRVKIPSVLSPFMAAAKTASAPASSSLRAASSAFSSATLLGGDRLVEDRQVGSRRGSEQRVAAAAVGRRDGGAEVRLWCWRRCRPGRSSPPSRTGRTCGRGSGRRRSSCRSRPAVRASICSSTTSAWNWASFASSRFFGPTARKPVAISSRARSASSSAGSRSPAICSTRKRSKGMSALTAVDDVVAVPPGVGERDVRLLAARLGEPGHVEPVPAPALAELRARPAAGRPRPPAPGRARRPRRRSRNRSIASGEGGSPTRSKCRRRSRTSRLGVRRRGQAVLLELARMNASSDRLGQDGVRDGRGSGRGGLPEGPELGGLASPPTAGGPRRRPVAVAGVGGAHADPSLQVGEDGAGQPLLLGGHLEVGVGVGGGRQQPARVGIARDDRRARARRRRGWPPGCRGGARPRRARPRPSGTRSSARRAPAGPSPRRSRCADGRASAAWRAAARRRSPGSASQR